MSKLTRNERAMLYVVFKAHPAWFRARRKGERVTLASLARKQLLVRRAWRGQEGDADAAHEYRPHPAVLAEAKKQGLV